MKKKCLKTNIELIAFELSFGTSYFAALSVKLTITAGIFFFFFFFFSRNHFLWLTSEAFSSAATN